MVAAADSPRSACPTTRSSASSRARSIRRAGARLRQGRPLPRRRLARGLAGPDDARGDGQQVGAPAHSAHDHRRRDARRLRARSRRRSTTTTHSPLRWWPASVAVTETRHRADARRARQVLSPADRVRHPDGRQPAAGSRARSLGGFARALRDDRRQQRRGRRLPAVPRDVRRRSVRRPTTGCPTAKTRRTTARSASSRSRSSNLDRLHFDAAARRARRHGDARRRRRRDSAARTVSTRRHRVLDPGAAHGAARAQRVAHALLERHARRPGRADRRSIRPSSAARRSSGTLGGAHASQLIRAQADFLADKLLDADGAVANGYDLAHGRAPTRRPTLLESQASAIRGLLEAYLATSDDEVPQRAAAGLRRAREALLDERRARSSAPPPARASR